MTENDELRQGLKETRSMFEIRQRQHKELQKALRIIREHIEKERIDAKSDPKFPRLKFDENDNIVFHKQTSLTGVIRTCMHEKNPKRYK